jgi:hypothetical protein
VSSNSSSAKEREREREKGRKETGERETYGYHRI